MKKIIILNKKEGETPLECLESFRMRHKEYQNLPMTYAGRLDPMASGVLLVLAGEECKKREKYLKLSKEYEFSVLFGFITDTHDILGKVTHDFGVLKSFSASELEKAIKINLKYFKGKFLQKYPIYSSRTVDGEPLFAYAREGKNVEIPEHEVEVKSFKFLKLRKITSRKLSEDIIKRIRKVNGDFRQKEILKIWSKELEVSEQQYFIATFYIKCGGGTYVRAIANDLGVKIGVPALAFSIKRTKIGKWSKI